LEVEKTKSSLGGGVDPARCEADKSLEKEEKGKFII